MLLSSKPVLVLLLVLAVAASLARDDDDDDAESAPAIPALEKEARAKVDSKQAPVVETRDGKVSGTVLTSAGGRRYYAYLGIPYALPPVKDLRFKFPRRVRDKGGWSGVRRCDSDPPKCPQLSYPERQYEGEEDCLYLNVYTHNLEDMTLPMEELAERLRSVLVWLHGGNFQHGSGTFADVGPERFMDNEDDVLLVVPNYRLNALGFLSVGEDPAVGNAGMKDVFTALSWVHSNIAQFGGHPGRITLGGSQAGGAAAHLHALSPLSSHEPDLFLQTVSLSGNALAPWAVLSTAEARRRAIKLGRKLGCVKAGVKDEKVDAPEMVRCLRTKPAEDIVRNSDQVLDWQTDLTFPFVPSVERFDGHNRPFMIAAPDEVMRGEGQGLRASKTWMAGMTTHDGLPHALQTMVFKRLQSDLNNRFEDTIWDFLGLRHLLEEASLTIERQQTLARRLRDLYLPEDQDITLATLPGLVDLTSDALYYHSLHRAVLLHSSAKRAPVLLYRFGFDRHKEHTQVLGVPLGTDSELMFPGVFANEKSNLTEEETLVSKKMLKLLSNFVAIHDPTPEREALLDDIEWPPIGESNFSYLDIGLKGKFSVVAASLFAERMSTWDSIFTELRSNGATKNEGLMSETKRYENTTKSKDEL